MIVYPISKHDAHLAPDLAQAILAMGNNGSHAALVVASPEVMDEADSFLDTIAPKFGSASIAVMQLNPYGGWPMACNQMFAFAARTVLAQGDGTPWLWHEMDACPTRPGWADSLTEAYQTGGAKYLGCIKPTMLLFDDGRWEPDGSNYLSGVAIYPHDMARDIEAMKGIGRTSAAFDIFLRHEMKARGMAHTPLIQHRWRTSGYIWEGKLLTMGNDPEGDVVPRKEPAGIDPATACVVHGCLDGSLARCIVKDANEEATFDPVPKRRAKRELVEA